MYGTIVHATSRFAGSSTVGVEAVGQTVISLDNTLDFSTDVGIVNIKGQILLYDSIDYENKTITLVDPLTEELPAGTRVLVTPPSVQRWAFVQPDDMDVPKDAIWALIPHSLSPFVAADGLRLPEEYEKVKYERDGTRFVILDVLDRRSILNPDSIEVGTVTVDKIEIPFVEQVEANTVNAQNALDAAFTAQFSASQANTKANQAISDAAAASSLASAAKAAADGAIRTYGPEEYPTDPPWANGSSQPADVIGDLWLNSDGVAHRWNGSLWYVIPDSAAAAALAAANAAQSTADAAASAADAAQIDVDFVDGRVTTAEADIDAVTTRVTTAEGQINTVSGRVTTAETNITNHETRIDTAEGSLSTLDGRLDSAESSISSHSTRITTAEGGITSVTNRVTTAEGNISSVTTRVTTAEGTLASHSSQITTIDGTLTTHSNRMDGIEGDVDSVTTIAQGLRKTTYSANPPGSTANTAGETWFQVTAGEVVGVWKGDGGTSWTAQTYGGAILTHLDAGAITVGTLAAARIASNAITADKIASNAVTAAKIEAGSIDTTKIVTAGLDAATIKFGTMSGARIETGTLTVGHTTGLSAALSSAEIAAIEAPWQNTNSTFSDWTGTYPVGFGSWSTGTVIKNTTDAVAGPYAAEFNSGAAVNDGISIATSFDTIPLHTEYVTIEVDVMLKSGNFSGAGVLVDWTGRSPARNSLKLAAMVPSPVLNKWYRVTQVLKRLVGTGTQTDWTGYLMSNYASDGLGPLSAKNIVYDRLGLRPSTQEEITAYNAAGEYGEAKTLVAAWKTPGQTTIDGGKIQADSILATSLTLLNFDNLIGDPNFKAPLGQGWSVFNSIAINGSQDGNKNAGVLAPNAGTVYPVSYPHGTVVTENGASYRTRAKLHSDIALPAGVVTIRVRFWATDGTYTDASGGTNAAIAANGWGELSGMATCPSDKTYTRMGYFFTVSPHTTQTLKIAEPSMTRAANASLIVDGAVTADKVAANAITATKINAGAVEADKIATNAVTAVKISANAVEAGKIAANAVTATTIAANAIIAEKIASNAVTADKIVANAITADKLDANAISAKHTLTGPTIRTAATGERLEISTTELSAIRFFSGAPQELEPGRVTSDVVDEPFPSTPSWTQRRSSLVLRAPQINSGTPTAALELSSVQIIDPFVVEVQPQVNVTGTLNASGLSVGNTGILSGGTVAARGQGGTTAIPGLGFRYTNSDTGDNNNNLLPGNFLGRTAGQLTPIGNAPADGVRRQVYNSANLTLSALGTPAKKAHITLDAKGLYGGAGAAYWHLLISTDNGVTWIPVQENFRAYNYGFNQWDVGCVLSGWVPTMKIHTADPARQSNSIKIRVECSNDATSGGDLVIGLANYSVSWFG